MEVLYETNFIASYNINCWIIFCSKTVQWWRYSIFFCHYYSYGCIKHVYL